MLQEHHAFFVCKAELCSLESSRRAEPTLGLRTSSVLQTPPTPLQIFGHPLLCLLATCARPALLSPHLRNTGAHPPSFDSPAGSVGKK